MLLSAASAVMLVFFGVTAPTHSPGAVDLSWRAPDACPPAAAVDDGIQRGLPAWRPGASQLHVQGVVSQLGADRWRVDLTLQGPEGTGARTLEGPTCAAVSDAAALVIALAINTELEARQAAPTPPAPSPAVAPPDSPSGAFVGLAAAADAGGLPQPTAGGVLSGGWRLRRLRLELGVSAFIPRQATVPGQGDTGARFNMAAVDARACFLTGWGRLALGPCADLGLNWTRAAGFGPPTIVASSVSSLIALAGGGVMGEWPVSRRVVPFLAVGVVIPLVRPQFSVKDVGGVHTTAGAFFRGAAGLELRFQ